MQLRRINWFSPLSPAWRDSFMEIQQSATVVFSCPIVGQAYAKHGTTIETRLTVIDKIVPDNPDKFVNCLETPFNLSDLLHVVVKFVPERQALIPIELTETKTTLSTKNEPFSVIQDSI